MRLKLRRTNLFQFVWMFNGYSIDLRRFLLCEEEQSNLKLEDKLFRLNLGHQ